MKMSLSHPINEMRVATAGGGVKGDGLNSGPHLDNVSFADP